MEKPATNITVAVAVEVFPIPRSGKLFAWGRLCLLGILRGIDEFFVHRSTLPGQRRRLNDLPEVAGKTTTLLLS